MRYLAIPVTLQGDPARGVIVAAYLADAERAAANTAAQLMLGAEARGRQADPAWVADYRATRPKVERKLGHLMRRPPRRATSPGPRHVLGVRGTAQGWAVAS